VPTLFPSAPGRVAIATLLAGSIVGLSACSRPSDELVAPSADTAADAVDQTAPDALAGVIPNDAAPEIHDQPTPRQGTVGLTDALFEAGEHERRPLDATAPADVAAAVLDAFVASDLPWTNPIVSISLVTEPIVGDGFVEHSYLAYVLTEHGVAHAEVSEIQSTADDGERAPINVFVEEVEHSIGACVVWLDDGPIVMDCI